MGNIHQAGVKKDDHGGGGGGGGDQQLEVVSVLELQAGAAEDQLQPLGGWPSVEATSMLENDKTNSTATDGIVTDNMIDISPPAAEPDIPKHDDLLHPWPPLRSLPEGVLSVLNTSQVKRNCIGDGDGFTACKERIAGDTNIGDPQQYRIRMKGIDAPELQMEYGVESKDELVRLIGGKRVSILVYGIDKYGRSLGDIYCDGVFIQEQMLKGGFAWHYNMCDKRPEFAKWQREAKVARRGLWSLHKPQKPWVWRRDNPRINTRKENADDNKVEPKSQVNGSSETLPLMIMKDMEDLGRKWKENLENFVSENMKLHDLVQEELKRDKKEAEDRAKKTEKEMKSVVADNMKLTGQLQESERNKKAAEDRILQLEFFSGSVAAVNMDLHHKIEVLENENKEADDRAKEKESEMESVGAENRKLKDQLQVAEGRAVNLTYFSGKVVRVNMVLHDSLEELKRKNKQAEERAEETHKEMESILNDNIKLNDQIQKLKRINKEIASSARNSKKKLQSVLAVNMDLDKKEDLGTSSKKGLEIVGAENMKGKPQGISHKKSEQTVEIPSTPPAKDFGVKEWRKKTTPTTSSAPPPKGHYE